MYKPHPSFGTAIDLFIDNLYNNKHGFREGEFRKGSTRKDADTQGQEPVAARGLGSDPAVARRVPRYVL